MAIHGGATSGRHGSSTAHTPAHPRARRYLAGYLAIALTAISVALVLRPTDATAAELVANPSVETANASNSALPQSWSQGQWGTNTSTLSYQTGGGHTGNRFLRVVTTAYTNGDAKWMFGRVPVQANTSYTFADWYRSTATTQLVAELVSTTGTTSWVWIKSVPAATAWTRVTGTFTTPANTASATVYHLLSGVGTLDTHDTSPLPTARATTPPLSPSPRNYPPAPSLPSLCSGSTQPT